MEKSRDQLLREIRSLKKRREQLEESISIKRAALESTAEGILIVDGKGKVIDFNEKFTKLWNIPSDIVKQRGDNRFIQYVLQQLSDPDSFVDRIRELYADPDVESLDEIHFKDGRVFERYSLPLHLDGKSAGRVWSFRDVTERGRIEEALHKSEEKYRNILENIEEGYYEVDLAGNYTFMNEAICRRQGCTRDELMGMNNRENTSPENAKKIYRIFNEIYRTGVPAKIIDYEIIKKDGSTINLEMSVSLLRDASGKPIGFRGVSRDVTEKKKAEERLHYLANYDSLTGLLNRALFRDRLSHAVERALRNRGVVAVLFIDLDRFKSVNDTLGHEFGDKLLQAVARRIKECLRKSDTIARLGGDEFTIMLEDIASPERAVTVAKKILQALVRPISVNEHEIYTSASIGITVYPGDAADIDGLLRNADSAMYLAKERGRSNYQFFTPEMNAKAQERLLLESSLRRALEKEEFLLYYQPQVDIETGGLIGFEALLRWRHPDLGMLAPDRFIPIAEETGTIIAIGEWVLRTACTEWRSWRDAGFPPVDMAVNISILQFRHRDLPETLAQILKETNMDPRYLELELTETALMTNPERCRDILAKLKAMGIRFAIDDFGTGYSSLSYLKRYPIDTLKIDRSILRVSMGYRFNAAIVQVIIALGRTLRMCVMAEGVETLEQSDFLKSQNCRKAQGYLFSPPLTPDAAVEWLKKAARPPLVGTV